MDDKFMPYTADRLSGNDSWTTERWHAYIRVLLQLAEDHYRIQHENALEELSQYTRRY